MTARPWGTTGRVTLTRTGSTFTVYEVRAAGCYAGLVIDRGYLRPNSGWSASQAAWRRSDASDREKYDLPSLDAAVMWVLRRAAPDVWRQERGPVPRVNPRGVSIPGWHVHGGDVRCPCTVRIPATWSECMAAVTREATP